MSRLAGDHSCNINGARSGIARRWDGQWTFNGGGTWSMDVVNE
jgi:hypothetical protein